MDTEIQPREPNEKQKAAAYDKFMGFLRSRSDVLSLSDGFYARLLRNFALEAPDGSKEG